MDNEEYINIDYETIGVKELRQLQELTVMNRALTKEEFFKIVNVYASAINRLSSGVNARKSAY